MEEIDRKSCVERSGKETIKEEKGCRGGRMGRGVGVFYTFLILSFCLSPDATFERSL